jgi:hypothetical protein
LRRIENSETEERRVTEMAEKDQRALLLLEWLSVKFRVKCKSLLRPLVAAAFQGCCHNSVNTGSCC